MYSKAFRALMIQKMTDPEGPRPASLAEGHDRGTPVADQANTKLGARRHSSIKPRSEKILRRGAK
jgi:hypothetical protein